MLKNTPLSLYIHFPWCIRKCPYCDFNSLTLDGELLAAEYIHKMLQDLTCDLPKLTHRSLTSIYFGGGTPSLFSPHEIAKILDHVAKEFALPQDIEITFEANPGTIDAKKCQELRAIGINRISLGVQSFQDAKLKALGRIHDALQAKEALHCVQNAGFENYNLDLMFGLPEQTIADAVSDLQVALQFNPKHISWYQLAIEPTTNFAINPPLLPPEDIIWNMQQQGQGLLAQQGYEHYEISAYAQPGGYSQHNMNYWTFGDYLGIGSAAHSKITIEPGKIQRFSKIADPSVYLRRADDFIAEAYVVNTKELLFECLLNMLRLAQPIKLGLIAERTNLNFDVIISALKPAIERRFLEIRENTIHTTEHGKNFFNDMLELFIPDKE
jgi:putative oxygen-independent coproporphyrinogen III oxidase